MLEGKVVLITGGTRGIGRELVRAFLKEGAFVVATGRWWAPDAFSAGDDADYLRELRGNPNAMTESLDITADADVQRVYSAVMAKHGRIDVLVNNAAMRARDIYAPTGSTPIIDTTVEQWRRMFETNVFGTFNLTRTFAQAMIAQGRGSIINLSSEGRGGVTLEGPYQPAKAALNELTRFLAHELKPNNIAANVLIPGFTRTTGSDEQSAARAARLPAGTSPPPIRRLRPDASVPLALFLAGQDGSGVSGQTFNALRWNEEQGLGGYETWGYGPDVEAARAAGTL